MGDSLLPYNMCLRKEKYESKKEAREAVEFIIETAQEVDHSTRHNLRAYKCPLCSKWHIGGGQVWR
jgi:hypothetical protein